METPNFSGLAGGLLATGLHPLDAASTAAYLHGQAAHEAQRRHPGRQVIAGDLVAELRAASLVQPSGSDPDEAGLRASR